MSELKSKLLRKNRKLIKRVSITVDDESVELELVKPTVGDRLKTVEQAQEAGDIDDEGKPITTRGSARFGARMIATCLLHGGQPLFGPEDVDAILDAEWFEDLSNEVQAVFQPDPEKLRGNS